MTKSQPSAPTVTRQIIKAVALVVFVVGLLKLFIVQTVHVDDRGNGRSMRIAVGDTLRVSLTIPDDASVYVVAANNPDLLQLRRVGTRDSAGRSRSENVQVFEFLALRKGTEVLRLERTRISGRNEAHSSSYSLNLKID